MTQVAPTDANARAQSLHRTSVVVNGLDSTWLSGLTDSYLADLQSAGVTASNITVNYVPWFETPDALRNFARIWELVDRNAERAMIVGAVDDIDFAKTQGKTGLVLGFQSPRPIGQDLGLLAVFHRLGLRVCGISYQRRGYWANGSGEDHDDGLSRIGRDAIAEMNRLGIVVDISHAADRSSAEAVEISKHPVIASHSNARAVRDHFRNLPDDLIRLLASKGGVIGVGALSSYLREDGAIAGSTFADMIRHIDHIVNLVGIDHVAVGTDAAPQSRRVSDLESMEARYSEFPFASEGPIEKRYTFRHVKELAGLTEALVEHGYSDDDIRKVLGGNFLRVFREVWGR